MLADTLARAQARCYGVRVRREDGDCEDGDDGEEITADCLRLASDIELF